MNFYQVCVIGLCFVILENTVTGNYCEIYPARFRPMQSPFYFGYMFLNSDFNVVLKLKNVSRNITAVLVTIETDGPVSKHQWNNYEGEAFTICGALTNNKVTIGLELYSSNGLCATRLVSEGRHVSTLRYRVADSTYKSNHLCLMLPDSSCAIEMDLRHDCIDRKKSNVTPKPTQNTSTTFKHAISYTAKSVPNIPDTVRHTSGKPNSKIPDTPRPTQSTSGTTRRKSKATNPAISYTQEVTQNVRNTSRTPNSKISDTPKITQSTLDASRHASSTLKPTISYTPKISQHIPETILNTSPTPNRKIHVTQKPRQNDTDNSRHTLVTKPAISSNPKAPRKISDTSKTTHNISKDHNNKTTSVTPEATLNTSDIQQETRNIIKVITNVTKGTSDTSNAVDIRTDCAEFKKSITITISSTVSILVLILLVFVIRRWRRIKRHPSGSSTIMTNDLGDSPFYLNMLFRNECDREIELIEQHHYEEINPQ